MVTPLSRHQIVGKDVQLPLAAPKFAVAELQVQPAYQVSFASRTAPIYDVAMKKALSVLALNAGTAVSAEPLM